MSHHSGGMMPLPRAANSVCQQHCIFQEDASQLISIPPREYLLPGGGDRASRQRWLRQHACLSLRMRSSIHTCLLHRVVSLSAPTLRKQLLQHINKHTVQELEVLEGGCELSAVFKPLECIFFMQSCGHISEEKTEREKEGARLKIDKL